MAKKTRNEGVIIFYKDIYQCSHHKIQIEDCISLWITLESNNLVTIPILGVYRTPSIRDPTQFTYSLEQAISHTAEKPMIIGDINLNIDNTVSCEKTDEYLNVLNANGYISCINLHTRVTQNSHSIIDHIFIPNHLYDPNINAIVLETNITDHYSQILVIPKKKQDKLNQYTAYTSQNL